MPAWVQIPLLSIFFGTCIHTCPSGAMDSASDFGSGGWGFESPLGLFFFAFFVGSLCDCRRIQKYCSCKFGRVVKALALGASLARGMGSNPIACTQLFALTAKEVWARCCWSRGCSSLGRAVGSQSAGTGIETLLLHFTLLHMYSANGVSVTLKLPKL